MSTALIGYRGCGKTTVGKRLADSLWQKFVDTDELVVKKAGGRTIRQIFEEQGEAAFRDLEADTLEELLEHHEPCVIAAGGGVVVRDENRQRLRRPDVTVVFLDGSPAFLASRVEGKTHRPLIREGSALETLTRLHAERAPLYAEVADLTVRVEPFHARDEQPKQALAERIAELVVAHEAQVTT